MLRHRCRTAAALGAGFLLCSGPLSAQLNLGASAGAVRYETVPATGSLVFNPDLTLARTRLLWNLAGSATTASDGSSSLEGGTTLWGATPMVAEHVQLDGMLQGAYTSPRSDSTSYSLLGFGEAAFTGDEFGVGVGGGVMRGGIAGQSAINALRASVRGWKEFGPWTVGLSVQPTALSTKVWFTDVTGTAEIDRGNKEISGSLLLRQSPGSGLDLGGEGSFTLHITPRVAFAASAGRYLRDPFQGLPQGFHVNVGVVLTVWRPAARESEGVGKADLTDLSFKALGISPHGLGHSAIRINPATSKKLSGSGAGGSGRGHKL
jgi:hypothetical protein